MNNQTIEFKAGTVIEVSFAAIKPGMEQQLFGEYFPKVMPILAELGGQSLGSVIVAASNSTLGQPQMSALFQWSNLESFSLLHDDERFLAIKSIRDDALSLFNNGNFFVVKQDTQLVLEQGQSYALVTSRENNVFNHATSLLSLTAAVATAEDTDQPAEIQIRAWDQEAEQQLLEPVPGQEVFKISANIAN